MQASYGSHNFDQVGPQTGVHWLAALAYLLNCIMTTQPSLPRSGVALYLLLTLLISSVYYSLVIYTGHIGGGNGLYVTGLMWSPALAAVLTLKIQGRSFTELGWKWGETKYQWWSYLIPLAYAFAAYLVVWLTGLGGFYKEETVTQITAIFGLGPLAPWLAIALYVLFQGTLGMISSSAHALGEEIGWRGFLVPELFKKYGFVMTSLITGVVWSCWHYPIVLFADYKSGTPAWYGLSCFTVMVIGISFLYTWMRIKSVSLWTGVFLHASHNLFIQSIFTPLTFDTGNTPYIIDEFGIALPLIAIVVGVLFWRKRNELLASTNSQEVG